MLSIPKYTMEAVTTIKLGMQTKGALDQFRQYKNESYDEVVSKLIFIAKNVDTDPELSEKTVAEIEAARARIKAGEYYTEEEMAKFLGIE
jgi:predicted transcriptional regulator